MIIHSLRSHLRLLLDGSVKAVATATVGAALLAWPNPALAQFSITSGTITSVYLSAGSNGAFRVALTQGGTDPLSGCANDFAYLNTDHTNYQAIVAALMTAYALNKSVRLVTANDGAGGCRIFDIGA